MGVAQSGGSLVLGGKPGEVGHHGQQLAPQIPEALPVEDHVGIVGDIAAGGAQVNDARSGGSGLAVSIDVGHDVMADFLFPLGGGFVVNIGDVGLQFGHLLRRHRQTQVVFGPGQGDPQPPPGLDAGVLREEVQHEFGGVPGRQRGFVTVFGHRRSTFLSSKS